MCSSSSFVLTKIEYIVHVFFFSEESNCFSQFFHIFCFSQHCVFQAQSTDAKRFCVKSVFWQYFSSLHILQCYCILTWSYHIKLFLFTKRREPLYIKIIKHEFKYLDCRKTFFNKQQIHPLPFCVVGAPSNKSFLWELEHHRVLLAWPQWSNWLL